MGKKEVTSLIPSKDESRKIISRVFKAQMAEGLDPQNIRNLPIAIFQAWCGHMMLKAFDRISSERDKSANEFKAEVEKAVKRFEDEIKF